MPSIFVTNSRKNSVHIVSIWLVKFANHLLYPVDVLIAKGIPRQFVDQSQYHVICLVTWSLFTYHVNCLVTWSLFTHHIVAVLFRSALRLCSYKLSLFSIVPVTRNLIAGMWNLQALPYWGTFGWFRVTSERHGSWPVSAFLHKRLVELSPGTWVDDCPALLAVILQARDIGAEEGCKLASAAGPVTLIAHLVV